MDDFTNAPLTAELARNAQLLRVLKLTGNLTRAAQRLGLPQPTASRRLAALGRLLGAPLTTPDGRGIRLTRPGELLADAAERALTALEAGERAAREEIDPERGHVVLGFQHLFGRTLVPGLLRDFRTTSPHVRFTLVQGSRQDIVDRLADGEVDLGLVAPPSDEPGFDTTVLGDEEVFVSVPEGHDLAGRAHVRVEDLEHEVFVMLEHGYGIRTITDEACARAGFAPTVAFEGQESDTVRGLVAAGLGITVLPKFGPGSPAGVVEVPLRPRMTRTIGLVWRTGRPGEPLPPAVAAFRDFVGGGAGQEAYEAASSTSS